MSRQPQETEGASIQERLIEACRRDNVDLLNELLAPLDDDRIAALLNDTTTVMGNHLYHEAASRGNYDVIDALLDQPGFECDPVNRLEGDTPLHCAIRWINAEPPAQREFGNALVSMMLEAGSSQRVKNKGGLTPLQLVDPRNVPLKELMRRHEYASFSAGDFVRPDEVSVVGAKDQQGRSPAPAPPPPPPPQGQDDDDDAEFSGSDEEERAEWERRKGAKRS